MLDVKKLYASETDMSLKQMLAICGMRTKIHSFWCRYHVDSPGFCTLWTQPVGPLRLVEVS